MILMFRKREVLAVDEAGMLSFITFGWLSKYMFRAYKKGITMEDLPNVPPLDSCDYNAQRSLFHYKCYHGF